MRLPLSLATEDLLSYSLIERCVPRSARSRAMNIGMPSSLPRMLVAIWITPGLPEAPLDSILQNCGGRLALTRTQTAHGLASPKCCSTLTRIHRLLHALIGYL